MPSKEDEAVLLRAARQGDPEAFGKLYEDYAPQVFRYLYANLDERMEAEDLTGEVFLRVWQALPGYREKGFPFRAFLFRVARNALIDRSRRLRQRRSHQPLDEERMAEHVSNPGGQQEQALEHEELYRLLGRLREDYHTVLALRFLAGLSPEEIAQAMGKSNSAVRVLQHRALAALRKILANSGNFP